MEKSVLDITVILKNMKKVTTTTDVRDIDGTFVVKLHDLNITNYFQNTKLPLNEDENNFDEQLNDINYKRTVRKLHDAGSENSYLTSADFSIIGHGCGVSQYPQVTIKSQICIKC